MLLILQDTSTVGACRCRKVNDTQVMFCRIFSFYFPLLHTHTLLLQNNINAHVPNVNRPKPKCFRTTIIDTNTSARVPGANRLKAEMHVGTDDVDVYFRTCCRRQWWLKTSLVMHE